MLLLRQSALCRRMTSGCDESISSSPTAGRSVSTDRVAKLSLLSAHILQYKVSVAIDGYVRVTRSSRLLEKVIVMSLSQYVQSSCILPCCSSFRLNVLQRTRLVYEVVGVGFWHDSPLVWQLHIVLVSLLLCKRYCVFARLEFDVGALHEVSRRLPSHQWILPSVPFR